MEFYRYAAPMELRIPPLSDETSAALAHLG